MGERPEKHSEGSQGILLAAFGSGSSQGESSLRSFDAAVRERFGLPVRWAFTSELMRERLASARKKSDSLAKALRRMAFERFTDIVVQPLHVVPGLEYADIAGEVELFRSEARETLPEALRPRLALGAPLLSACREGSEEAAQQAFASVARAAAALLGSLPAERQADEAVLWMGHGSRHASTSLYSALGRATAALDPLVLVGTINGDVRLEELLPRLAGVRRVWLVPLLALVGRHALEDMAGKSPQSWKSRLEAAGFTCTPLLKGIIEYPAFAEIWLDHLAAALQTRK